MKKYSLLFAVAFLLLIGSYKSFTYSHRFYFTVDSLPINFTVFNILFEKRFDLTNYQPYLIKKGVPQITVANTQKQYFSKTPLLESILSLPFFAFYNAKYHVSYLTPKQLVFSDYGQILGKFTAAWYVSLSAVILFLLLFYINQKLFTNLFLVLIYILATNVFNIASQANLQHGFSLFFIVVLLFLSFKNYQCEKKIYLLLLGLLLGILFEIRLSNLFYLLGVIILVKNKRLLFAFFLVFVFLNKLVLRHLQIPYGYSPEFLLSLQAWNPLAFLLQFCSLLFSFNYGLLTYSPILGFAFVTPWLLKQQKKIKRNELFYLAYFWVVLIYLIFVASWWSWTGGLSLNARLLTEILPILILWLNYALPLIVKNKIAFLAFTVCLGLSLLSNFLTVYTIDWSWYNRYIDNRRENQLRNAWFFKPTHLAYLWHNFQTRHLIYVTRLYRFQNELRLFQIVYQPSLKKGLLHKFSEKRLILFQHK